MLQIENLWSCGDAPARHGSVAGERGRGAWPGSVAPKRYRQQSHEPREIGQKRFVRTDTRIAQQTFINSAE